jgi:hypothetical protein
VQKGGRSQSLSCSFRWLIQRLVLLITLHEVSNAGEGPLNVDETRQSIRQICKLTDRPFGIGATLLMPGAAKNAKVALEEQVPLINVTLGKGEWIADGLAQYGDKLLATVTNKNMRRQLWKRVQTPLW